MSITLTPSARLRLESLLRDAEATATPDRYEIRGTLGQGGASIVYRAWDRRLQREVALKVLRAGWALAGRGRARFAREARVLAQLSHPNIVTLHDAGEAGGSAWLVTELVRGVPLSRLMRGAGLERLVRILMTAARAVHHAHGAGVVHRDLKPANILVADTDEPKVADFGLAHLAAGDGLSRTDGVLGTPLYMAPEQVRRERVTPATDVYALGAILYEMLAGRTPFAGSTPVEIYTRVLTADPAPPPGPRDLATIALRAIEKDPARRYATAHAFAEDLRRFLEGRAIVARRPSGLFRLARRRGRAALAAAGLAAALAFFAGRDRTPSPLPPRADDRALHQALAFLEAGQPEEAMRALDRAPQLPITHHLVGRAWSLRGWDDRAEASWRRAIELDPAFGPSLFQLGRLMLVRGYLATIQPSYEPDLARRADGERLVREAVGFLEAAMDAGFREPRDRQLAEAMLAWLRGDRAEARRLARAGADQFHEAEFHWLEGLACVHGSDESLAAFGRAIAAGPRFALARFCRGASLYMYRDDARGALADYDVAIAIHPRFLQAHTNRAAVLLKLGDAAGAVASAERAIEIDPACSGAWTNRGVARGILDDFAGARADLTRSIELDPDDPLPYVNRALVDQDCGDVARALVDVSRAIALRPSWFYPWYVRARLRDQMGDRGAADDARAALERGARGKAVEELRAIIGR